MKRGPLYNLQWKHTEHASLDIYAYMWRTITWFEICDIGPSNLFCVHIPRRHGKSYFVNLIKDNGFKDGYNLYEIYISSRMGPTVLPYDAIINENTVLFIDDWDYNTRSYNYMERILNNGGTVFLFDSDPNYDVNLGYNFTYEPME